MKILDEAFRLASRDGFGGLSLGRLAAELGLSKIGLFAHFGSKEELELEIMRAGAERFTEEVVRPALKAPRGVPRLRQMFERWLSWMDDPSRPGGCVFLAAASEFDDRPGPQRALLAQHQTELLGMLTKAIRIAVEEGQLPAELDCDQMAFEILGIALAYHHKKRLLDDPRALERARRAFEHQLERASAP